MTQRDKSGECRAVNTLLRSKESAGRECWKVANIMATYNYEQFKLLDGNRDVKHFKKLVKSIMEIGILYQPILVNELFEIVEGQGRYFALKKLGKPVIYTVQPGIGIKECRHLNSCSTNWGLKDYIHSYATGSDARPEFEFLEQLQKEFPEFGSRTIYGAAANRNVVGGGSATKKLHDGDIDLSPEDYIHGRKVLGYLRNFNFLNKALSGRIECMHSALIYCYNKETVDNEYLLEKVEKHYGTIPPISNVSQAIAEIERVYNFNIRGGREPIYIKSDFEKYAKQTKTKRKLV